MTRLVVRSGRVGLTRICTRLRSPVPLTVSPMIQRTVSPAATGPGPTSCRSEEHTSELQSLMRISYAVVCLKKKKIYKHNTKLRYIVDCAHSNNKEQNYMRY